MCLLLVRCESGSLRYVPTHARLKARAAVAKHSSTVVLADPALCTADEAILMQSICWLIAVNQGIACRRRKLGSAATIDKLSSAEYVFSGVCGTEMGSPASCLPCCP